MTMVRPRSRLIRHRRLDILLSIRWFLFSNGPKSTLSSLQLETRRDRRALFERWKLGNFKPLASTVVVFFYVLIELYFQTSFVSRAKIYLASRSDDA